MKQAFSRHGNPGVTLRAVRHSDVSAPFELVDKAMIPARESGPCPGLAGLVGSRV
jgi:hypothetical protein